MDLSLSSSSRRNSSKCTGIDSFLQGLTKGITKGIIMDMNRNTKRKVGHHGGVGGKGGVDHHDCGQFSQQSILSAMDKFVAAVNNMDDTVMVPSRLMDMSVQTINNNNNSHHPNPHPQPGTVGTLVPPTIAGSDMYSFYSMLNSVKNELIWGNGDPSDSPLVLMTNPTPVGAPPSKQQQQQQGNPPTQTNTNSNTQTHTRRLSMVSMQSYSDSSDVESESSSEFDSGAEFDEQSTQVATAFRQHLHGLLQALHQLTDAADYLTTRYQDEVGGAS